MRGDKRAHNQRDSDYGGGGGDLSAPPITLLNFITTTTTQSTRVIKPETQQIEKPTHDSSDVGGGADEITRKIHTQ